MKSKGRVVFGYFLIICGILLPLVAFSSMSYREIMANRNYKEFVKDKKTLTREVENYNERVLKGDGNIIDPFKNEDYEGYYDIEGLDKDEVFAYLIIPKLEMKKPIYLDATYDHLDWGVAQVEGTSLPLGGMSTRSVIAGHRGWWGDLMFYNVEKLEAGDEILIDGRTGLLKYEVVNKEVIDPSEWQRVLPIENRDMITLLTCHPKRPPRPKRLLINAQRVEEVPEKKVESKKITKDKNTSNLKYTVYGITLVGWISFVIVFRKMIGFLRGKRR